MKDGIEGQPASAEEALSKLRPMIAQLATALREVTDQLLAMSETIEAASTPAKEAPADR